MKTLVYIKKSNRDIRQYKSKTAKITPKTIEKQKILIAFPVPFKKYRSMIRYRLPVPKITHVLIRYKLPVPCIFGILETQLHQFSAGNRNTYGSFSVPRAMDECLGLIHSSLSCWCLGVLVCFALVIESFLGYSLLAVIIIIYSLRNII